MTTTGERYTRIPGTPVTHHSVRSSRSTVMSSTNTRGTPTGTSLGLDVVLGHVIMSSKIGIR